jgi:hypothetical protein
VVDWDVGDGKMQTRLWLDFSDARLCPQVSLEYVVPQNVNNSYLKLVYTGGAYQ